MEFEKIDGFETKTRTTTVPRYAWVILGVLMLAGVTASINQFKAPPIMTVLMEEYSLSLGASGLLMSIFAITGLALALPSGLILQKMGLKGSGLLAMACLAIGSGLGAVSTNVGVLLFSRFIEGAGFAMIGIVAPALITLWFPRERRGLPLGIWATWVSLGSLIIYRLAPVLEGTTGWRSVWWAGMACGLAALVLVAGLVKFPGRANPAATRTTEQASFHGIKQALVNRNIWLLALAFGCFNFIVIGVISTYFPTFLTTIRDYNLVNASAITSIKMIVVILTAPLAGLLIDKIGSIRRILLVSFAGLALFMLAPFSVSGAGIPVAMVALGILSGFIPAATFSAIPEAMQRKNELMGVGMAVIVIGQNLGQLAGPVVFGPLVERVGWASAGYGMIGVLVVGMLAVWFVKVR